MAEGIGNINQNVVELYRLVEEQSIKIDAMYDAMYPEEISEPTSDGAEKNKQ
jgi:hypothetical protein